MISRHPNRRASIEKAPGPSRTMDAAAATSRATQALDARAAGTAMAAVRIHRPAALNRAAAMGVIKPNNSEIPQATASAPPM